MTNKLRWGIIGTGSIAQAFAFGLTTSRTGTLQAVASRTQEKADEFGSKWDCGTCYGSYEALLADKNVDAVYIATPHPMHPEWAIKAAEAGKHIIVEKPIAVNSWQAEAIVEAAMTNGVTLMEAYMYRCHPQIAKVRELLRNKAIGQVRMITASFSFGGGDTPDPQSRTQNKSLAGGGILDVGGYPVSMARMIAGEAIGKPFDNPVEVKAVANIGEETGVDEWAAAVLKFKGGIVAQVSTGVRVSQSNDVTINGSQGSIYISTPWVPNGRDGVGSAKVYLRQSGKEEVVFDCSSDITLYGLEADAVADAIPEQQVQAMSWEDTLGNMDVLDEWRRQINLKFDDELPHPVKVNIANRPIKPANNHKMKFGTIPGVDKPVSKLIFGALTAHGSYEKAQIMFDKWIELGGNTFDTGQCYGPCDAIFGNWVKSRGIRDDIVIIGKGNHPPYNHPEHINMQVEKMLNEFHTDMMDIYIMHRDNIGCHVSEWIDALNEQVDKGRMKVLGGSNWTTERFIEANKWAAANGKQGLTILNNNLALAEMVNPVWDDCLHVSDQKSRKWMEENKIVHLAWSSTARGFFTDISGPDKLENESLVNSWYSERNFAVKERAIQLAEKKGCAPINIAAAWVLNQPFSSFALIGPETPSEMVGNLPSLDIVLSPEEIAWLAMDK
ncbi:MAG: aldo/keto reductase [Kiritimatiellae bacterium]|jgi:predicted dehydrogenase/aryl-alcohol dehydrogenase-like predicted oxidoreductase|nr:aldo/keto reductase [Kiritimatiellia bacterium]